MLADTHVCEDGKVLYASDSITDVLGYVADDVIGKTCFDYFHDDEKENAIKLFDRSMKGDKAAVLNYCRLKRKNGEYIVCECVFTVVYNVVVACTSLYQFTSKSQGT